MKKLCLSGFSSHPDGQSLLTATISRWGRGHEGSVRVWPQEFGLWCAERASPFLLLLSSVWRRSNVQAISVSFSSRAAGVQQKRVFCLSTLPVSFNSLTSAAQINVEVSVIGPFRLRTRGKKKRSNMRLWSCWVRSGAMKFSPRLQRRENKSSKTFWPFLSVFFKTTNTLNTSYWMCRDVVTVDTNVYFYYLLLKNLFGQPVD